MVNFTGLGKAIISMYIDGRFRTFCKCFVGFNESENGYVFSECSNLHWNNTDSFRYVYTPDGTFKARYDKRYEAWLIEYSAPITNADA